ncbi:MAG: hypothetical protein II451_06415 [Oscillospiraceae bacterium]|nr:hypothetical protein [Oscillospiraceae bacterium]
MAIWDRMRDRMRGRRAEEPEQMPEEQQGWGRMPEGSPDAWNERLREEEDERDLEAMARPRTAEEEAAARMGEQMGAEALVQLAGMTPKRLRGAQAQQRGMTRERLNKATETLLKYKSGKESIEKRVIRAQQWWKLKNWEEIRKERGVRGSNMHPSNTGWLWNCIVGKHADWIDSYPEPVVLPRMADDKDEAKKLSSIIPVVLEMNEFEQTYNDCMWQKGQEGTGVYGVFWNNQKLNGLGDIDITKVNILNLFWEPGISDIQDSRNVFYVSFEDKAELVKQYPELEGKISNNKLSIQKYKTDDSVDLSDKAAVIDWYYKTWQDGRQLMHYCKYVDETVLYSSEEVNPAEGYYADGNYPFVLDALYPVEGSPAGYGYIDIARDTQSDIDTLSQAMVKHASMSATPRYFMRKDGGVNEEEFADWSKPIVHTNGMLGDDTLRQIVVNNMGGDTHSMLQQKIDEIKFITGNTDINNGGVPSGVTAASAIAALKEDSGRSSKDSTKAAYRAYRLIVIMVIERIRQFYDIPRQFRIMGQQGNEMQFTSYSNAGLQVQEIENLPGQEPGLRLPVFDIEVRAQRENAYTKMSQNELALQFWSNGMLNPQMTDQALITLEMMDFRGIEELKQKIQAQGTMQQTLMKVAQIAMQLAMKYDPAAAEMLAGVINGVAQMASTAPANTAAAGQGKPQKKLAPDDATEAAHEANENGIVRKARERAANASRPD